MDIRARYRLLEEPGVWQTFTRGPTLRRTVLRHLRVGLHDLATVLLSPGEPYFADVREAGEVVRRAARDFGAGSPTVHSMWLYKPIITGDPAESWLDEVVDEHRWWWPNDVTWICSGSLRLLYRSDSYGAALTLFVWGTPADLLVHRLVVELALLPKVGVK
jgi:hypothetical protein